MEIILPRLPSLPFALANPLPLEPGTSHPVGTFDLDQIKPALFDPCHMSKTS